MSPFSLLLWNAAKIGKKIVRLNLIWITYLLKNKLRTNNPPPTFDLFVFVTLKSKCCLEQTLPKAQKTRGLSSYHKFLHNSGSNFNFRILIKHYIPSLNQTSVSWLNLNKSWPNLASESWTSIQPRNRNQTSAAKYWQNFSFKISPELQLQNLDQSAQRLNKS